jgi:hypothetical protein
MEATNNNLTKGNKMTNVQYKVAGTIDQETLDLVNLFAENSANVAEAWDQVDDHANGCSCGECKYCHAVDTIFDAGTFVPVKG